MLGILAHFEATLDTKGRFLFPAALKKQLPEEDTHKFVINRDLDGGLSLYTLKNWEPVYNKLQGLNEYDAKQRTVKRFFLGQPSYVEPDSAGRILIPNLLKTYANLDKNIVLHWSGNKLEIWDSARYKELFDSISQEDLSSLVNDVLGGGAMNGLGL